MTEKCPACEREISDYSKPHCERCGHLLGWPNYRKAKSEQAVLEARYQAARHDLQSAGLDHLLSEIEQLASGSRPVIGMDCFACSNLLKGGKYRNYYTRVAAGDRNIAPEANHGDRLMVNERIYPGYGRHLQYGLLSPNGRGLTSYGPISVSWRVDPHYLGARATLLEENEFRFFEAHKLGVLNAVAPSGYRAIWNDRAKLVVAKLAPNVDSSTGSVELERLLMAQGDDRWSDDFVEVVMYAEGGVDSQDVTEVRLLEALTDPASQREWQQILEMCAKRGIRVGPL